MGSFLDIHCYCSYWFIFQWEINNTCHSFLCLYLICSYRTSARWRKWRWQTVINNKDPMDNTKWDQCKRGPPRIQSGRSGIPCWQVTPAVSTFLSAFCHDSNIEHTQYMFWFIKSVKKQYIMYLWQWNILI